MIRSLLKISSVAIIAFSSAYAQEGVRSSYGIFGHYALSMHAANFQSLPETFTCGNNYTSGNAGNIALGAAYQFPFLQSFQMSFRAGYSSNKVTLRSSEMQLLGIDGNAQPTELEKSLAVNVSSITFEPMVGYDLYKGIMLHTGLSMGYLLQNEYSQEERIVTPGKALFIENGKRVRNESAGKISGTTSLQAGLLTGMSYDMPLNNAKTILVSPEILYCFGLTPYVSGIDWKGNSLKAGVSLKYSPAFEAPTPVSVPPPVEPHAKVMPLPALTANIEAVGVGEDGVEIPLTSVTVEEFLRKQSQPLLPYIFFTDNSAEIQQRYVLKTITQADSFTIEQLQSAQTLEAYYEMLNIIGRRMRQFPSASIVLSGCNSNTGAEKGNLSLSKKRAENVKDYLTATWKISSSRIAIQTYNLPSRPSNAEEPEGIEENRRVEISSSSPEILSPIIINDTLRVIHPSSLRFKPLLHAEAGIKEWNIQLKDGSGTVVKEFPGKNSNVDVKEIETRQLLHTFKNEEPFVIYSAQVSDITGRAAIAQAHSFPVEWKTIASKSRMKNGKQIESYNLVLFDFNKADLSAENERITHMIKKSVQPESKVLITGFTDRFGSEEYNLKLSAQRAQNVARLLGVDQANVRGLGESVELFDNTLPEGRFYSRTINITVETEKK